MNNICSCTVWFKSVLVDNLKFISFYKMSSNIRMFDKKVIQQCLVKYGILLRSSSDDRILWIRSGIEIMWLIEHVANGGQLMA